MWQPLCLFFVQTLSAPFPPYIVLVTVASQYLWFLPRATRFTCCPAFHGDVIAASIPLHVCNLTQRTIFRLSFTFAEYLICFARRESISSECTGEINCFKSAETSNKKWPRRADPVKST